MKIKLNYFQCSRLLDTKVIFHLIEGYGIFVGDITYKFPFHFIVEFEQVKENDLYRLETALRNLGVL